jgi:hypothetical protein
VNQITCKKNGWKSHGRFGHSGEKKWLTEILNVLNGAFGCPGQWTRKVRGWMTHPSQINKLLFTGQSFEQRPKNSKSHYQFDGSHHDCFWNLRAIGGDERKDAICYILHASVPTTKFGWTMTLICSPARPLWPLIFGKHVPPSAQAYLMSSSAFRLILFSMELDEEAFKYF